MNHLRNLTLASLGLMLAVPAMAQTSQTAPSQTEQRPGVTRPGPQEPANVMGSPSAGDRSANGKINLNTATAEELGKTAGIDQAGARAIVASRTKDGRFTNWDDFDKRNLVPTNVEQTLKNRVTF